MYTIPEDVTALRESPKFLSGQTQLLYELRNCDPPVDEIEDERIRDYLKTLLNQSGPDEARLEIDPNDDPDFKIYPALRGLVQMPDEDAPNPTVLYGPQYLLRNITPAERIVLFQVSFSDAVRHLEGVTMEFYDEALIVERLRERLPVLYDDLIEEALEDMQGIVST